MTVQTHPYAELSPEAVLDAVESFGFDIDARVFALNSYENRVYQVGLADGRFIVVKFYRPGRWSLEQILEEHQFSRELQDLEIPVIAPMEFRDCGSLQLWNGFQVAVFPHFVGRPPELDNLDNLLVMGRFIGRIHAVGAMSRFEHRPALTVEKFGLASREFILQNDFLPSDLVAAYDSLTVNLLARIEDAFAQKKIHTLRIHGDCHMGNVLWKNDTPNFVDFDDTMTGPAIQDLWMLLSGDRNQRQAQLLDIVEGYNEFHDFRPGELVLVEPLRCLRMMHYAAWLARRWQDPAFPLSFPWFNTERYWADHVLELREQAAMLEEPPLELM